jgi:hypothetical protein
VTNPETSPKQVFEINLRSDVLAHIFGTWLRYILDTLVHGLRHVLVYFLRYILDVLVHV